MLTSSGCCCTEGIHSMMNIVYVCCRCCCFVLLQLEDLEVTGADYVKPSPVGNFRAVWEVLPPESVREDV